MRIVVTGAGGFVGRHVLAELSAHDVIALDVNLESVPDAPNITKIEADLRSSDTLHQAFKQGCHAVIHLATVPGGAAEKDPPLAKAVNVDASMALIEKAAETGDCPRFVFASSIAVFGKLTSNQVKDFAPTKPTMLYGAHKLMMENWIATQSRRGAIEGISLRLPGIVMRPKSPSGMKSAFLSEIFHALRNGVDYTMPVSENATTWLCSVQSAARNLAFAATGLASPSAEFEPLLLPAICVKAIELEQEIRRQLGSSFCTIQYEEDKTLQSIFGEHPFVETPKAQIMGFVGDVDLKALVNAALKSQ